VLVVVLVWFGYRGFTWDVERKVVGGEWQGYGGETCINGIEAVCAVSLLW